MSVSGVPAGCKGPGTGRTPARDGSYDHDRTMALFISSRFPGMLVLQYQYLHYLHHDSMHFC